MSKELFDKKTIDEKAREAGKSAGRLLGESAKKEAAQHKPVIEPDVDTKSAEIQMGTFAKNVKRQLKEATDSLGDGMGPQIAKIKAELKTLTDTHIGVEMDTREFLAKTQKVRSELAWLSANDKVDLTVVAEILGAIASLDKVLKKADEIERSRPTVKVDADTFVATAKLTKLSRLATLVGLKKVNIKVGADTAVATAKLAALGLVAKGTGLDAQDGANAFRGFNAVLLVATTIGPALIPILAAVAGGIVAIGVAATGVIAGLGVMILAFSGITNAVQAMSAHAKDAEKETAAQAKTIRDAIQGVADAERALKRAREDSAFAAEEAARRVAAARRAETDAVQSAVAQQVQAQEQLAQAVLRVQEAEQNLADARQAARDKVAQVRDDIKQNSLDERRAVLSLAQAKANRDATFSDGSSTRADREAADIQYQQAKLDLKEIRDEEKSLDDQKNEHARNGVRRDEGVLTAQQQLLDAIHAQQDAVEAVGEASRDVDIARVEGARNVRDALRAQQRTTISNNRSISDAQRSLARAQQSYQDALTKTGDIGSSSLYNLRDAMQKLSPAGRRFARFLFNLRDEFAKLRAAAQQGVLPGVQKSLETLQARFFPSFLKFVRKMGRTVGGLFEHFGEELATNTAFTDFFAMIDRLGPRFMRQFGQMMINWMAVMARLMTVAAPVARQFSNAMLHLSENAEKWTKSAKGTETWRKFMAYSAKVGPEVWAFFKALWRAVVALGVALAPLGELVLQGLSAFLNWVADMDPATLRRIAFSIIGLVAAMQTMFLVVAAVSFALIPFESLLAGIPFLVVAVAAALTYLYLTNEDAAQIMGKSWVYIKETSEWLFYKILIPIFKIVAWQWLTLGKAVLWVVMNIWIPVFKLIADIAEQLWSSIKEPLARIGSRFKELGQFIARIWREVLHPALSAIGRVVTWLWKKIFLPALKAIGNAFITYFTIIGKVWRNVLWPVLDLIGTIVWELWKLYFKVVFRLLEIGWKALSRMFEFVWNHGGKQVFDAIAHMLLGEDGHGGLVGKFETAMRLIGKAWNTIKNLAKTPIEWVITNVMNRGIIGGFNKVARFFGSDEISYIGGEKNFHFAQGGVPFGIRPGWTPGRDTHTVAVGGGEAIMRPEFTAGVGPEMIHYWNKLAREQGAVGVRRAVRGYYEGGIAWPTAKSPFGTTLGAPFGQRGSVWSLGYHTGQDFPAYWGQKILSMLDGLVTQAGWNGSYGNSVTVRSGNIELLYGHMSRLVAKIGEMLSSGQQIGNAGDTGNAFGTHLHLELSPAGSGGFDAAVDPAGLIALARVNAGKNFTDDIGGAITGVAGSVGSVASWIIEAVRNPKKFLLDRIADFGDKMFDNPLGDILKHIPGKMADLAVEKIKDLGKDLGNAIGDAVSLGGIDTGGAIKNLVDQIASEKFGWTGSQLDALNTIVSRESGFNPTAQNPDSTAYGLFQFLDSTWSSVGGHKTSDPTLQTLYGLRYIKQRYGNPEGALRFWDANGYYAEGGVASGPSDNGVTMYDKGGYLPPGLTTVLNLTGRPEPVFTNDDAGRAKAAGWGSSGPMFENHFHGTDLDANDVAEELMFHWTAAKHGGRYKGAGL